MLVRDTLITILDETRVSRAPGTTMLTGGSESALLLGVHKSEGCAVSDLSLEKD